MTQKTKTALIISVISVLVIGAILNMEVTIRQGVNGRVREIKMPLYAKSIEFLARDYEYKRIAKEITAGYKTDEEKALAIFRWTHDNIRKAPPGFPIIDDHILNIIIRGYGTSDQSNDVFTALCVYSGLPAFWDKAYDNTHSVWYPVSFVKLGGKWRAFDSYYGKYFRNRNGDIASVEEILRDKSLLSSIDTDAIIYNGIPYKEFYYNLKPVREGKTLRSAKQMPAQRVIFEIRKILRLERENEGQEIL